MVINLFQKLTIRWFRLYRRIASLALPKPDAGLGRFVLRSPGVKLRLTKSPTSNLVLNGNVSLQSDLGDRGVVNIILGRNSRLEIKGDLTLGPGVFIHVRDGAKLVFGGRRNSSGSGVTCNTRIMCNSSITIGYDCIIAWNVLVTDCDWHQINSEDPTSEVCIGDRVWIAYSATILKGTRLGTDCVVGAGAVVTGKTFKDNSLVAGNPARLIRDDIRWCREMPKT